MPEKSRPPSKSDIKEFKKSVEPPKLELPEPIPIPKKVKSQMDFFSRRQPLFTQYKGNNYIMILFYLYLFNKYKSDCLIYDKASTYVAGGYLLNLYGNGLTLDFTKITGPAYAKEKHYDHLNTVIEQIVNCVNNNKSEIIIIPLTLVFATKSHANVMIYRKFNNTVEHFEPHGSFFSYDPYEDKLIEDALAEFMAILNKSLPDVRFKPSNQVCVNMSGLQSMEAGYRTRKPNEGTGYCAAWSLFFTELALKNPTIPSDQLLNIIYEYINSKEGAVYFRKVIRGYVNHISEKIEKYFTILFRRKITVEEIVKNFNQTNPKDKYFNTNTIPYMIALLELEKKLINEPEFEIKASQMQLVKDYDEELNPIIREHLGKKTHLYENIHNLTNVSPNSFSTTFANDDEIVKSKVCPEGKILSPNGRCVKIKEPKETKTKTRKVKEPVLPKESEQPIKTCPEGKMLSPKGRCVKIKEAKETKTRKVRELKA
jgi:hypothetical protein